MMILVFVIVVHKTSINFIYPSYLVMNNEGKILSSLLNISCIIMKECNIMVFHCKWNFSNIINEKLVRKNKSQYFEFMYFLNVCYSSYAENHIINDLLNHSLSQLFFQQCNELQWTMYFCLDEYLIRNVVGCFSVYDIIAILQTMDFV